MQKLFAIIFVLLSVSATEASAQSRPEDIERRDLPPSVLNTELQLLGGKTLKLSEYSGKPMIINLFSTSCDACRPVSPELAKLHKEYKDRGLVVIELSTEDPNASNEAVREWVRKYRLPYAVGWATPKLIAITQARILIPQTMVIARDGRIVQSFIGYDPAMTPKLLREHLKEALK